MLLKCKRGIKCSSFVETQHNVSFPLLWQDYTVLRRAGCTSMVARYMVSGHGFAAYDQECNNGRYPWRHVMLSTHHVSCLTPLPTPPRHTGRAAGARAHWVPSRQPVLRVILGNRGLPRPEESNRGGDVQMVSKGDLPRSAMQSIFR